jgi:hypothetical protein
MVKSLLLRADKKGVNLMIGYVLLIVIAISLSVLVFAYLKLYLPKDEPKCYEDVSVSIDKLECLGSNTDYVVSLNLTNRGLFTIHGVFIRIGEEGRVFKKLLNSDGLITTEDGLLKPEETWSVSFTYNEPAGIKEVEVEPFLFIDNKPALCEKAVVSQLVECV